MPVAASFFYLDNHFINRVDLQQGLFDLLFGPLFIADA
jgi:hypothetical protein